RRAVPDGVIEQQERLGVAGRQRDDRERKNQHLEQRQQPQISRDCATHHVLRGVWAEILVHRHLLCRRYAPTIVPIRSTNMVTSKGFCKITAPSSSRSENHGFLLSAVTMIMGMPSSWRRSLIWRKTSTPSICGIIISEITRSG